MANHKSAIKRHKQSLKRKARNKASKSEYRNAIKNAVTAPDKETAIKEARRAESLLASASKKGILGKGTAKRYISRLAKRVNLK